MDINDFSSCSVVVCDDSRTNVHVLSQLAEEQGVAGVRGFTDPREALLHLQESADTIDLLLLDIEMPHMSGIEVLTALRDTFGDARPFAVLVITGARHRDIRHQALQLGANDFLEKPFEPLEVVLRVRNLLRVQHAMKAQQSLAQSLEQQVRERTAELAAMNEKLEETVAQRTSELLRAEKMASVGRLAAGIAHEINNPLGFVRSNLASLKGYVKLLLTLVNSLDQACGDRAAAEQAKKAADLEFLRDDLGSLFGESATGLERVARIVEKLRSFSRVDCEEMQESDLNADLDDTIELVAHELAGRIEVTRDYASLPLLRCHAGKLNQVFLNLIMNAIQAIDGKGVINLGSKALPDAIEICIRDSGKGMSPEEAKRIFDPFYTTRNIGKGMGLGLSEAYGIVRQHGGQIDVESSPGRGASFRIRLPLQPAPGG